VSDDPARSATDQAQSPEEIRADIEQTREDLGDTVEALAAKTDVKARARERAQALKADATAKKDELAAKVKPQQSSPGSDGGLPAQAQRASQKALATAKHNPVAVAAVGALVVGYLVGRRSGR
jgi:chromosome segregation ATPase